MVTIIWNLVLSFCKLLAGLLSHSSAMISDAVHSASDVLSTIIVMVGMRFSSKESDSEHPYGHERMECIATLLLAFLLAYVGIQIGYEGILKILRSRAEALSSPGRLAMYAAVFSIVVKEWMFHYTKKAAEELHSSSMMADAYHHRSDALSSIGSFAGVLGARLGLPVLDPLAGVVICFFILKTAWEIFMQGVEQLTDRSCNPELVHQMETVILSMEGVLRIDDMKTRLFGEKIYVDVEIGVNRDYTVEAAHEIAERVHVGIENHFSGVKHCMVHVNPVES